MALVPGFFRSYTKERAHIIDPGTGVKITQLTSFPTVHQNLYFHSRSFTPDCKTVLFLSNTTANRAGLNDLYAIDTDGDNLRQLTDGDAVDGIALSPQGQFAYYASGRVVYAQDINTGEAREVARFAKGVHAGGNATMTDDGKLLCMFASVDGAGQQIGLVSIPEGKAWTVRTDYGTPHLQIEPGKGETAFYYGPRLPRIVKLNGSGEHEIPLDQHNGHSAWLGPTGKIYTASVYGVNRITMCDQAGGPVETIAEGPYFWHPGCDPTGEWIVSDTNWPDEGLWIINVKTKKKAKLCASMSSNSHPGWSHPHPCVGPGGKEVLFNSDRTGVPHVYAAHVPEELRKKLAAE